MPDPMRAEDYGIHRSKSHRSPREAGVQASEPGRAGNLSQVSLYAADRPRSNFTERKKSDGDCARGLLPDLTQLQGSHHYWPIPVMTLRNPWRGIGNIAAYLGLGDFGG